MKLSLLSFSNTTNIGDNIQSVAVAQHVNQEYGYVDRDFLNSYDAEPCAVVMNGWFSHEPRNWPPAEAITPIFFGFHMTPDTARFYEQHKDYFKRFEPIGCRDNATADFFNSWGVKTYVSGCATMTFPTRTEAPQDPLVVFVDQDPKQFSGKSGIRRNFVSHEFPNYTSNGLKFSAARELLDYYKEKASLVITSRIHCAIPCAAMGIPVLYTGIIEGRTKIIREIGIPEMSLNFLLRPKLPLLNILPVNYEDKKKEIIVNLKLELNRRGINTH